MYAPKGMEGYDRTIDFNLRLQDVGDQNKWFADAATWRQIVLCCERDDYRAEMNVFLKSPERK